MIEIESSVRSSFTEQAAVCETLGSPFTANLIRATESALDRSTATGRAILEWQGSPGALGDALALRVAGALHALAMSGQSSTLSAIYPPHSNVAPDQMRAGVARALREHDAVLLSWLQFAPQTNEVARSAALYLGLMEVCRRTRLPLRLLEIGSSGGLNLMLDHYEYIFDGQHFGSASSALTLGTAVGRPESRRLQSGNPVTTRLRSGAARLDGARSPAAATGLHLGGST